MRILSFVLALIVIPGLVAAPEAGAKARKKRAARPARVVKVVKVAKGSKALTADDPLLRVGVARPLTVADAHKPGAPLAGVQPAVVAKAAPRARK